MKTMAESHDLPIARSGSHTERAGQTRENRLLRVIRENPIGRDETAAEQASHEDFRNRTRTEEADLFVRLCSHVSAPFPLALFPW